MKNLELVYVRHNRTGKAPAISPSAITYYDLTVLLSGTLEYNINGNDVELRGGDMILIPSGSRRARKESDESADYVSFNFTLSERLGLPLVQRNIVRSEIVLLIAALDKMEKHAYANPIEKMEYLCGCILSIVEDVTAVAQYNPLTRKIMEYIHEDIRRRITLEDIGRLTFFSPIYCDTVFKKETGRSIIDYVLDRRINEAKRLLLEGTTSLSDIADAVGFGDYNYFSRVFKKRSGYSPTAYRRLAIAEMKG